MLRLEKGGHGVSLGVKTRRLKRGEGFFCGLEFLNNVEYFPVLILEQEDGEE